MPLKPLLHGITHNPRVDTLEVLKRLFAGPAGKTVADFLCENFVPPGEVDVDTFVFKTRSGEWCVGLEDVSRVIDAKWDFLAGVEAEFSRAMVSAEGDTAWLNCEAVFRLKFRQEGFLSLFSQQIAEIMKNSNGLIIADIMGLARKVTPGLFEPDCESKYAIFCRLSGILLRKGHPWRFQQIKLSFR